MRIEINACRFAINNLMNKGSEGFISWDKENNHFQEISWYAVLKWLDGLEQFYDLGNK